MYIKNFNSAIYDRTIQNGENIASKMFDGDVLSTQRYLTSEFIDLFEDLFFQELFADILYEAFWDKTKELYNKTKAAAGNLYNKGKEVVNKAVDSFKNAIQNILNKLKNVIKNFSIQKLWDHAKKGFAAVKKAVFYKLGQAAECLRLPLIDLKWVDGNNKFQVKAAYTQIMAWAKEDKNMSGEVDFNNMGDISSTIINSVGGQEMKASLNDSLTYTNKSMGLILESGGGGTPQVIKIFKPSDQIEPGKTRKDGYNLTQESMKTGSYGFFKRVLFKMGVVNAKANSLVSIMMNMAVIAGIFSLVVMPVVGPFVAAVAATGTGVAATAAVGAVVGSIGVAGSVVIILIAGVLFSLGLFMVITWIIKPYPNIYDLKAYLEAWFTAYPDGVPPAAKKKKGVSTPGTPTIGKFDPARLNRDSKCQLISKWHRLSKIQQKTDQETQDMNKVLDELKTRTITINNQKTPVDTQKLQTDVQYYKLIWTTLGCKKKKKTNLDYTEFTDTTGQKNPANVKTK